MIPKTTDVRKQLRQESREETEAKKTLFKPFHNRMWEKIEEKKDWKFPILTKTDAYTSAVS